MSFRLLFSHSEMSLYMLGKLLKLVITGLAKLFLQVTLNLINFTQQRLCHLCKDQHGWDSILGFYSYHTQFSQTLPNGKRKMDETHFLCLEACHLYSKPFDQN